MSKTTIARLRWLALIPILAMGPVLFWAATALAQTPVPTPTPGASSYTGTASTATTVTVPVALTDPARWAIAITGTPTGAWQMARGAWLLGTNGAANSASLYYTTGQAVIRVTGAGATSPAMAGRASPCQTGPPACASVWTQTCSASRAQRLNRRALMDQSCGCANARDAGVCRERIVGADAGPYYRVVPAGGHCALGLCQGAGCVPAPCTHSEARERCGGGACLDPEECRP